MFPMSFLKHVYSTNPHHSPTFINGVDFILVATIALLAFWGFDIKSFIFGFEVFVKANTHFF
jgi:hypothetical protein